MARKSKTQKNAEENNEHSEEQPSDVAPQGSDDSGGSDESVAADSGSDQSDAPVEDQASDAETDATPEPDAAEPAPDTEVAAVADAKDAGNDIVDAELIEESANEEEPDIPTQVAGAVPASAAADSPPTAAPPPVQSRGGSGVFLLLVGGIVAGGIGYLVATFATPTAIEPTADPQTDPELVARIDTLSSEISALSERVDGLPAPTETGETPVDLGPISERIDALSGETGGLSEAVATLQATVDALQAEIAQVAEMAEAPAIVSPDGSAAMEAQLESFRSELDAVTEAARAEIEEAQARASQIEADAAAAAGAAAQEAAISEIRAALESGAPFADALADLGEAPEALSAVASDGVRPLSALQEGFPDAARDVLQGAQAVPEDATPTDRLTAFLRRQTNARSLAPREGDSADAILSRAEAALSSGDVAGALDELGALPDDAKAAMSDWIADASARAGAVAALNDLNQG